MFTVLGISVLSLFCAALFFSRGRYGRCGRCEVQRSHVGMLNTCSNVIWFSRGSRGKWL